jgi:hypothetical protein
MPRQAVGSPPARCECRSKPLGRTSASGRQPGFMRAATHQGGRDRDVVIHTPILATTGNEIRGHTIVAKILQTAFACYGMPRNVEEFQNPDGRYIVTFDGSIDGNLIQIAILVTENAAKKVESIRLFARPWPVVKLFRQFMERNLRPNPVPDAIWNLPARNA